MTEQLKQAAQAALNACERIVDQEDSPVQFGIDFRALGSSLRRALTQRPAAQTEREAFERAALAKWGPLDFERSEAVPEMYYNQRLDDAWIGFGFAVAWLRASLPAPQQDDDDGDVTGQPGPLPETGWDEAPAGAFRKPSPTAGMNLGERIKHVGGRENAAGYIEFGSVAAVRALVRQYLRDEPAPQQATPAQDAPEEHRSFMQQFDDARANIAAISQALERSTPKRATPAEEFKRINCRVNGIDYTGEVRRVDENTVDIGRVVAFAQATPDSACKVCQGTGDAPLVTSGEDLCSACYGTGEQIEQATPEPVTLGPLAKRNIYDAIRGAYDLGYNDARNASTVPGDSAPGYDGRSVEEDHGSALFNLLSKRLKPATPEPVGEQATVPRDAYDALERERDYWRTRARAMLDHAEGTCWYWMGDGEDHLESLVNSLPVVIRADQLRELLAHPAPGVPEGLPAVLTDWGFDVHDDEDGRTWLTIRNPDDDVARMSVPTVWPLNGNQTIGAVVLHQFSAALTSALAAAQAKGGCDEN